MSGPPFLLQVHLTTVEWRATRVTGSAFYPSIADEYSSMDGMPFIRVADLGEFFVRAESFTRIPQEIVEELRQIATVRENDIVVAKGGSIGGISLIQAGIGTCALSRDVIAIHTDPTKIDSTYLVAFLLSRVGQLQLDRNKSQQVQAHLTFPAIGNVKVIVPSRAKQSAVAELVAKALSEQAQSQDLYTEAQTLLATELGLDKLDLSESLHSVRRALDVQASGRADAEYYKPKYQRLLDHIAATGQGVRLGDWVTEPIRRGIQPDYAEDGDVVITEVLQS